MHPTARGRCLAIRRQAAAVRGETAAAALRLG
jgi:hypothetical protein